MSSAMNTNYVASKIAPNQDGGQQRLRTTASVLDLCRAGEDTRGTLIFGVVIPLYLCVT